MKDETPQSSQSTPPYDRPPVRERIRALRETVDQRRKSKTTNARPPAADNNTSPCAGWFLAAEQFLELAIAAKTEEEFERFADLADTYEAGGLGCDELLHTLP